MVWIVYEEEIFSYRENMKENFLQFLWERQSVLPLQELMD